MYIENLSKYGRIKKITEFTMNLMQIYSTLLWQSEYPEFEEHKELFLASVKEFKEQNPTKDTTIKYCWLSITKNTSRRKNLVHSLNISVRWHLRQLQI